jgi:hypothetical protein
MLDPQDCKNMNIFTTPYLGHSRTIGFKWTWVVGIITHLGERRGGEGRGKGAPHLTSPKGAKQFFRPEDAPLYVERGNYEQTNNKQTCKKITSAP